jgi:hypothetical protein
MKENCETQRIKQQGTNVPRKEMLADLPILWRLHYLSLLPQNGVYFHLQDESTVVLRRLFGQFTPSLHHITTILILPVVLYVLQTWSPTLREEHIGYLITGRLGKYLDLRGTK